MFVAFQQFLLMYTASYHLCYTAPVVSTDSAVVCRVGGLLALSRLSCNDRERDRDARLTTNQIPPSSGRPPPNPPLVSPVWCALPTKFCPAATRKLTDPLVTAISSGPSTALKGGQSGVATQTFALVM
jgi:hypothetical protein